MVVISTVSCVHCGWGDSWMCGVSGSGNNSVETVVVIGGVMDGSDGAIGFV